MEAHNMNKNQISTMVVPIIKRFFLGAGPFKILRKDDFLDD